MDDVTKMVWSDFIDAAQSCTGCTLDSRVHPPSMKFEVWLGLGRRDSEVGTFHLPYMHPPSIIPALSHEPFSSFEGSFLDVWFFLLSI